MAVTRTLAQLGADLRIGDGVTEPSGAQGVILARIAATSRAMVLKYAPDAPDEIHDESFVRLSAWLFDVDPSGRNPGGPAALRSSGAASLLSPYRAKSAGLIGGDAAATATPSGPGVDAEAATPSGGGAPVLLATGRRDATNTHRVQWTKASNLAEYNALVGGLRSGGPYRFFVVADGSASSAMMSTVFLPANGINGFARHPFFDANGANLALLSVSTSSSAVNLELSNFDISANVAWGARTQVRLWGIP